MAVDPLIAKALTHLAVKVATDEETRKKMLLLILTPVLSVLLIMSLFFYILTHPLDFLGQFFDSQTLSSVEQLQSDFGMYQGIPQTDSDYTDSYGISYEGVTINKEGETPIIYITNWIADGRIKPMELIILEVMLVVQLQCPW